MNSTVNAKPNGTTSNKSNELLGDDTFPYPYFWSFGSYEDPDGIIAFRLVTWGIVIPIIAVIGLLTNLLNVTVLACLTKRKASSVYIILLAMATADILVTICFLLNSFLLYARPNPVLSKYEVSRLSAAESVIYNALNPAMNLFGFISNWCTVAMTTFRFIAVYFPLQASKLCTRRRATVAVVAIVAVAVLLTVLPEVLIAYRSQLNISSAYLPREYRVAYAIAGDVLPWISCVILVTLLLITFSKLWSNVVIAPKCSEQREKTRKQLTITLVTTATWFVVTTAPSTITVVVNFWDRLTIFSSKAWSRLLYIGQILVLINYNGNFFFYSFINNSHRQQLKDIFRIIVRGSRQKWKWNASVTSSSEANKTFVTTEQ